jgi:serine/threonine protein phosphatase PrpC
VLVIAVAVRARAPGRKPERRDFDAHSCTLTPQVLADTEAAIASTTGPTRERNEDAVATVDVPGALAVIVADGLGGHPEGARASRIAADATARFLERMLPPATRDPFTVEWLIRESYCRAARRVAVHAKRRGFGANHDGMRTTLLIAVALEKAFVVGILGDGGVIHVCNTGVRRLLAPQRSTCGRVAGSLGPTPIGEPRTRVLPRGRDHELIAIASDGVDDPSTDSLYALLLALSCEQPAVKTVTDVLEGISAKREDGEPVAQDNLSLGVIVSRRGDRALTG